MGRCVRLTGRLRLFLSRYPNHVNKRRAFHEWETEKSSEFSFLRKKLSAFVSCAASRPADRVGLNEAAERLAEPASLTFLKRTEEDSTALLT
jgi:hypothetical protein